MSVTGYPSVTSVLPGETIQFFLSTDAPGATPLTVERVGSAKAPPPADLTPNLTTQPLPPRAWEGFGWAGAADTAFTVPVDWASGLYVLKSGFANVLSFVVRAAAPGAGAKVLVLIEFLTLAAYNDAGGKSLYGFNSGGEAQRATKVSLLRAWDLPDYGPPGLAKAGLGKRLIDWLEGEAIDVEYASSLDLHADPNVLDPYDCLVVHGHDEYWTRAMRDHAERFVAGGGNLIVLSGNTAWRAARLEDGDTTVVFHKYPAGDPNLDNAEATVAWAAPPLNRPPNSLFGAGFTAGAFSGPGTAYQLRFPSHWVFDGVAPATQTSPFMSYETDAAAFVEEPEGYPRVTGEDGSPLAVTVLASADLAHWSGKPGQATISLFSRGGTVFHAGTTDWLQNLGPAGDPVLNQITHNVFKRLGQRTTWDWEDIGHANFGAALTSAHNRLFIATRQNRLWMRHPVGAEVNWRDVGHANGVIAMAGAADTLWCLTANGQLWWRPPVEVNVNWTPIGAGPPGARSLAVAGGVLWATDIVGDLWRAPARRAVPTWLPVSGFPADPTVKAMTAYAGILFAATDDDRLLRTPSDFITDTPPSGWAQVWHCDFAVGLAVVEWMLFVATDRDRLWRLDLSGLRAP